MSFSNPIQLPKSQSTNISKNYWKLKNQVKNPKKVANQDPKSTTNFGDFGLQVKKTIKKKSLKLTCTYSSSSNSSLHSSDTFAILRAHSCIVRSGCAKSSDNFGISPFLIKIIIHYFYFGNLPFLGKSSTRVRPCTVQRTLYWRLRWIPFQSIEA